MISIANIANNNRAASYSGSRVSSNRQLSLGIGEHAVVQSDICPGQRGRVHFRTDWFARSLDNQFIPAGTTVILLQRDGVTWLVAPAAARDRASAA